jgi:hypothetical protein
VTEFLYHTSDRGDDVLDRLRKAVVTRKAEAAFARYRAQVERREEIDFRRKVIVSRKAEAAFARYRAQKAAEVERRAWEEVDFREMCDAMGWTLSNDPPSDDVDIFSLPPEKYAPHLPPALAQKVSPKPPRKPRPKTLVERGKKAGATFVVAKDGVTYGVPSTGNAADGTKQQLSDTDREWAEFEVRHGKA